MFFARFVLSSVCLFPLLSFAADPHVVIKKTNVVPVSAAAGPEMFKQYCASCHGLDAKGHGRAVPALKVPPPDLTLLSQKNHGKFPSAMVYTAIRGDVSVPSHGSPDMPVWGLVFHEMANNEAQVAERMSNLSLYIQSLQQK